MFGETSDVYKQRSRALDFAKGILILFSLIFLVMSLEWEIDLVFHVSATLSAH